MRRALGTMVAYGFPRGDVKIDLAIAARLGATCLEVLPDWRRYPDPGGIRDRSGEQGFHIHSAHGCWGGQAIRAGRVDLGSLDPVVVRESIDDIKRAIDWLEAAGGRYLVVHPGGLSDAEEFGPRRAVLRAGLSELADHARGTGVVLAVENMPPGVHPGSRMSDLAGLVAELERAEITLALDTGHANLTSTVATETLAAERLLGTTHVHDNDRKRDSHEPPGTGTIDWRAWRDALDLIGYSGPIMLECIRHLREHRESLNDALIALLEYLRGETDWPISRG